MRHIVISIEYAGLTLPVTTNEQGNDCVPLKPISELLGLHWPSQHAKVGEEWPTEYLGVCVLSIPYAGDQKRQMTCIRLDRVAAYLMSLNPAKIRAAGNESGAAFLKAKLTEWADALHDYETFGSAHNPRHADALLAMRRANAIANVAKIKDASLRRIALSELGIDDTAGAAPTTSGDLFSSAA
jgi:hypothetical protein